MKYIAVFFLSVLVFCTVAQANGHRRKHKYRELPKSEAELVSRVLSCFRHQDTIGYYNLFPPFDTLWHMVMHNNDKSPEAVYALNQLKEHPRALIEFDPFYNPTIMERFCYVMQKGSDSGIHWSSVVISRFELQKEPMTKDLIGYDKVSPERFMGYVFVRDIMGRVTFCMTMTEIQKINEYYVGGQVFNIMEASTIDEYNKRVEWENTYISKMKDAEADSIMLAQKRDSVRLDSIKRGWLVLPAVDSAKIRDSIKTKIAAGAFNNANVDDDTQKIRREVIDRKYYEGKFDDEIPVELYVRYMKDLNNGKAMFWDALYKFGDQENYIKLDVIKTDDKWEFDDDPPVGSMELFLKNRVYTGVWTNNENQSGYDVVMKETVIAPKKLEKLEKILEQGLWGRTDDPNKVEKKQKHRNRHRGKSKKKDDADDDKSDKSDN